MIRERFEKYYPLLDSKTFAERFGYSSPKVVRNIANRYGITKQRRPIEWTEEELSALRAAMKWRHYTKKANLPERTQKAILEQARQLRIKERKNAMGTEGRNQAHQKSHLLYREATMEGRG